MEIIRDLRIAVTGYLEQQRAAHSQAVEAMKQERLVENSDFPHAHDCPKSSGLSIMPHIPIWGDVGIGYYTNARCDDCNVVAEIKG